VALLAGGIVFASVYAAATSLVLTSANLSAGLSPVASCDTSFDFAFDLDAEDRVIAVVVSDIATACEGGELTLNLLDSSGASIVSGSALVNAATVEVTVTGLPPVASVKQQAVIIVGP
jgi:hypothetical protein